MSERSSSPYVVSSPNFRREEDQNPDELIDALFPIPNHINAGDADFIEIPIFGPHIQDRPEDLDSNASSQNIPSSPNFGSPARVEDFDEDNIFDESDGSSEASPAYPPSFRSFDSEARDEEFDQDHDLDEGEKSGNDELDANGSILDEHDAEKPGTSKTDTVKNLKRKLTEEDDMQQRAKQAKQDKDISEKSSKEFPPSSFRTISSIIENDEEKPKENRKNKKTKIEKKRLMESKNDKGKYHSANKKRKQEVDEDRWNDKK